ncbi:glycosyltransferase family 2 protein [Acetobacter fallax]|uniref:Glycosyltransferase n=1 Tax=Acetobacter fallax TaxID=1737473 RepID=A0ABX0KDW8_9PROT|nr:glycosyltransferase family 2 protein [Acetobacter fallax]NHO33674.1 glycosyltransferase [Acetobacter fallax]NHO36503.1 glycosyltransferase [Acetobacter fallax]
MPPPMISIIIANYNYGEFIREAIESVLWQDWPLKEIIVIDDGSTDDSRSKIMFFGDEILAVFTENHGQRCANNLGFSLSHGDIIVFLDADDILLPGFLSEIVAAWNGNVSKIQVLVQRANRNGLPAGNIMPKINGMLHPTQIHTWSQKFLEYPTPPGSGNAWSRKFLDQIFPLGDECDSSTDSTCIAMAPYFGDVVTIAIPLVLYRMHGSNDSNMTISDSVYSREVGRAIKRFESVQRACVIVNQTVPKIDILFRGSHLLQLRIASMRLTPSLHPLKNDSMGQALINALKIPFCPSFETFSFRIMITIWCLLTAFSPLRVARILIRKRFYSSSVVQKKNVWANKFKSVLNIIRPATIGNDHHAVPGSGP